MSSVSCFSFPFDRVLRSDFPGTSLQNLSRKRRRNNTEHDIGDENQLDLPSLPQDSSTITRLSSLEGRGTSDYGQARGAALAPEEDLPGGKFPHAPSNFDTGAVKVLSQRELETGLAKLKPPLYIARDHASNDTPSEQGDKSSVRQRHLGVLTSIMHNCLAQGDYIRAGRAWGILLRTEVNGHPFDPRIQGRWGIGAEILLRRDARADFKSHYPENESDLSDSQRKKGSTFQTVASFSKEDFLKAKSYYESLILQYPVRKLTPTAVNSLYFYPAMFGLWIYSVQEQHKAALGAKPEADFDRSSDDERDRDSSVDESQPGTNREDVVRRFTLHQAEGIAARLDELLLSPPYIDDATLWKLRGMIALWISDLCILNFPLSSELGEDDSEKSVTADSRSGEESEERMEAALKRNLYDQSVIAKKTQVGIAERAFANVIKLKTKVREET